MIIERTSLIGPASTTSTLDEKTFDRVVGVNLRAPFFLTQAVVPGMLDAGAGVIVNLGSLASIRPGGYLVVGATERVTHQKELGLVPAAPFTYRKEA